MCTIIIAIYVPPDADSKSALNKLGAAIGEVQATHPNGEFVVTGEFSHSNVGTVLPKFHQNASCPMREDNTLDHIYTNITKVVPLPYPI